VNLVQILDKRKRLPQAAKVDDDIRVLSNRVEYFSDNKTMKYLIYEMEALDNTGEYKHFFKAIKLIRIIRLPKDTKQSLVLMEKHAQALAGIWESGVNFITVVANMISPIPLGLLFLYGVQGIAETVEDAKKIADNDFASMTSLLQGTYRVLEYRPLNFEEMEWLREKMYAMKHMTVVRGLPIPREGGADIGNKGFGSKNLNPESQETTEEFIVGMSDKEYVLMILSTPVGERILREWLTLTAKELTRWNSQAQGQKAISFGVAVPMMYAAGLGSSSGWSQGYSDAENIGFAHSESWGTSFSESVSESHGVGTNIGVGQNIGTSESAGINYSEGESASVSRGFTEGTSYGYNEGENTSFGYSRGISDSVGISESTSTSLGVSEGRSVGRSEGVGSGYSQGLNEGTQYGTGGARNIGTGAGAGASASTGEDFSGGAFGIQAGISSGAGTNLSDSTSEGAAFNASAGTGRGASETVSQTASFGNSITDTRGTSMGTSQGTGLSVGRGTSEGWSEGYGQSRGQSWGASTSESLTNSRGTNVSNGWSKGIGVSEGISTSEGRSESFGTSYGVSRGTNEGESATNSTGRSFGTNSGLSGGLSQSSGATMGLGPSLSFSKTFQWIDMEVKNIITLLEFQNQRLMVALNGSGAFFSDIFIATPNEEAKASAQALAKSAWFNRTALICPLQVMDLPPEEQSHLLYHFNAFSADCTMEGIPGQLESYRYSTVLLPDESTTYTHPPRISEGGIFADVLDIPKFAVPSMRKGEIYMGKILSGERWTQSWGYVTPYDFRLSQEELMHGFFTGESRSGKTVAATRFIAEIANKVKRDGKKLRIVCMDPKQDWRILAKFVEPERFHFYSLGSPEFAPINLNICKIPQNVYPQQWIDGIIEIYCRAYGLGERGKSVLSETFYELYDEANVFVPNWREVAPERSKAVTFTKIYERMRKIKLELEDPRASGKGKVGNDVRDAYSRVLDRLQVFGRPFSIEHQLFGRPDGLGIDDLIGGDDVVVLESYGLELTFKNFIFGVITAGFFKYAQAHEGGFKSPNQYETILVIEEANEVLLGSDTTAGGSNSPLGGQSEFEKILDQAAGLGLFIFSITQKIADMPSSVVANSGLVFAGKISRDEDVALVIRKLGREERYDDRDLLKWFPRAPIGWFVCRSSRNFDFKEAEPSLVKIEPLETKTPTNEELLHLVALKQARQQISKNSIDTVKK